MKALVSSAALALVFLANCDYIFGPDWEFGEAEMRAAVEGTWKLTRKDASITLVVKQASAAEQSARDVGFVTSAAACGTRSFVKQAAACSDETSMPLEITADKHVITGAHFNVYGTGFQVAILTFELDGAPVSAQINKKGTVKSATLHRPNYLESEDVKLERIAR